VIEMSTSENRRAERFPKLSPEEVDRGRRFGTVQHHRSGERLLTVDEMSPGMFVIISGSLAVARHEGLARIVPIVDLGPDDFIAEVGEVNRRPSLVDARAITEVEALLVPSDGHGPCA
jgi:thioredoxin reductase (NADPH)